jgi:hypothetical protein
MQLENQMQKEKKQFHFGPKEITAIVAVSVVLGVWFRSGN